jgi:hypothetical protein
MPTGVDHTADEGTDQGADAGGEAAEVHDGFDAFFVTCGQRRQRTAPAHPTA